MFGASFRRFKYARHSHETYAFGTVEQGAMRFWHGGTDHLAVGGEIITLNPGEVHDGRTEPEAGCRYRMLYVERSTIEDLFAPDEPRFRRSCALTGPVLRDARLARCIGRFTRGAAEPLAEQSGFAQVLYHLFARYGAPPLAARPAALERECVARAKSYMIERLGEPLHLADVAAAVRLSTFYFLRTFKRATGMPPHAYLNQIRLERAREMLRAGEPPAQVAAATGFVDQSHLSRRFKGAFGVTPSQYRDAA